MKKAVALLLVLLLFCSIVTGFSISSLATANSDSYTDAASLTSIEQISNDWPMFLYNAAHTSSPDDIAPVTHDLLWRFNTMPDGADSWIIDSSPAVVGGVLYIGSNDGHFYALDSTSGDLLWSQKLGSFTVSSPAIVKGVVYVGIWEGRDYALNATTGEVIWNLTRTYSSSSPAVVSGLYYICSGNSSVIARNTTTGSIFWESNVPRANECSPVVVDDTVYISDNGYAYALDAQNGAIKWTHDFVYASATYNSPAVADGIFYASCGSHTFFALNATTGATIWTYETGSSSGSAPTVSGGIVYVGSLSNGVFALNAANGDLIWNYPTSIWDSSFAFAGGILYACNSDGIHALDAKTGTQIWLYTPSNTNINSAPAVANGILYVRGGDCYLYAFGKTDQPSVSSFPKVNLAGTTVSLSGVGFTMNTAVTATFGGQPVTLTNSAVDALGHISGNFEINPSTASGTYQISVTDSADVTACVSFTVVGPPTTSWPMYMHDPQHTGTPDNFVPTSNNTLWTYKVDKGEIANHVASSAAVVEGIVYTASQNGYVYALDAYTGECYWKYSLPGMGTLSSPSVVDGVVYIGSDYGLFALNAYTGEKIWQAADGGIMLSSPAVSEDLVFIGSFVAPGPHEHAVFAFRVSDGAQVWKFPTGDYVNSSPVVVDNIVYVGCEDNWFYALNANDGSLVWKFSVSDLYPYDGCSASPAVVNGVVYTSSYYGNVYAIDSLSGSKIWNHSIGKLGSGFSSPIVSNGYLYIATKDSIYALSTTTGDELWCCNISSSGSLAIVGNIIYANSVGDGKVWAIDALTGQNSLHYVTGGGARVPLAIARGVIYVGIGETIYAIGTPDLITPQPTPTPTPTSTQMPTSNPTANPTQTSNGNPTPRPTVAVTPKPSPTPLSSNTVKATTNQGTQIELSITGNITSTQISNVTITTNQTSSNSIISFTITGQTGNTGFFNLTIPKNTIFPDGTPTIQIDGVPAQNQGFSMDENNFYVWGETHFSTHQMEIVFTKPAPTPTSGPQDTLFPSLGLIGVGIFTLICVIGVVVVLNKRKLKRSI